MESEIKSKKMRIGGMTCISCQNKIEKKLRNTAGVLSASVSYRTGTAEITYDTDIISIKDITAVIEKLDYEVLTDKAPKTDYRHAVGILIILLALFILARHFGLTEIFNLFPTAEADMGYAMLFVIGLLTSVHCIAMCGGINLSQCIPPAKSMSQSAQIGKAGVNSAAALRPSFLYNLGRVVSYTAIGFLVGALGSVLSFSSSLQGILKLAAGIFMIIIGINMFGIFPIIRKLTPSMPRIFSRKIDEKKSSGNSPLIVGLLNGFMPCGPLQAMQIYALSTGSPITGALSMLLFSLGTVPMMFGLGALSSMLSKKFTHKVMTVGAVLVMILGFSMLSQGWTLSGLSLDFLSAPNSALAARGPSNASNIVIENGIQIVKSTLAGGRYPSITVQVGKPVKWTIDAPQGSINGCNNRMRIPEYGIRYQFKTGENIIEFTPDKTGTFRYSCWMGMIRGSITVV
ncbi:MAG: sulfite exporter TauE/SafE family protein [Elusimicrobiota bacterium]|jgi:sulfite exporter TauE/SafE/copper chaperone CopZ|nr:sulfite exporter TauE/SafE family protein [Elusimicrobiota bacterium]